MKFGVVHARKTELQAMDKRVTKWPSHMAGAASSGPYHEAAAFRPEGHMP